jgi:hypothetical protein
LQRCEALKALSAIFDRLDTNRARRGSIHRHLALRLALVPSLGALNNQRGARDPQAQRVERPRYQLLPIEADPDDPVLQRCEGNRHVTRDRRLGVNGNADGLRRYAARGEREAAPAGDQLFLSAIRKVERDGEVACGLVRRGIENPDRYARGGSRGTAFGCVGWRHGARRGQRGIV